MKKQILKIENLSHRYNQAWAIRDINLEINETGITGLLGSNGAGKSTTMNIMCGVLNQTEGKVYIEGLDMRKHPEEAKKKIGFLPQHPPLYMDFTVDEYLMFCAKIKLVESRDLRDAVEYVKKKCGVSHFSDRQIRNLSGGYRQRVGIAQAIIHQPRVVILDEPTNGLDPNQIVSVRSLIKEIAEERAVIFSSHILSEVDLLCDHIVMIEGGKMVFSDSIESFNNLIRPHSLLLNLRNPPPKENIEAIAGIQRVDILTKNLMRVYYDASENRDIAEILITSSVKQNWRMIEINFDKTSIDEIFAQLSNQEKRK